MMGQNPMMGQGQMMGQMNPMMGQMNPMMGQSPMMQQSPVMGQMMQQPPMMQEGPMSRPVTLEQQDKQAAMRHKLREFFSGGQGPITIPLPSVQDVMQLESNLHQIKAELVRSFYQDLVRYKQLTGELKQRMKHKVSLLRQIEARLASPLRSALMDGRLDVPLAPRPRRVVTTHVEPGMEDQIIY